VWGGNIPSVSVGLRPWVGTARSERHKRRIRNPQPSHHLVSRQRVCAPLPHSAVLVCRPPLSQIRMEYWHPTGCFGTISSVFVVYSV